VLRRVLRGRLTFTPRADAAGDDSSGSTRFDELFTRIAAELPAFIERETKDAEDIGPEGSGESDYERLLGVA
jgi:hypothetical protein